MFCGKCGSKIEDGVKFCPSCGARVGEQENLTVSSAGDEKRGKAKRKNGILIFAIVLLIILFIGVAIWWIQKKPIDDGGNIDTQQMQESEVADGGVTDKEEQENKSKIKTEEAYSGARLMYKFEYDIQGNRIYYDHGIGYHCIVEYSYLDGKVVSMITKSYDENGNLEGEEEKRYEYDDTGVIQKAYRYDKSGNLIGEIKYNEDGQILSSRSGEDNWTNKYDSHGNKVEEIFISGGDTEYERYFKYDEENRVIEGKYISYEEGTDSIDYWTIDYYSYAKNGLLTESKHASEYGENIITYNRYGDKIEVREYDEDGNFEGYIEHEYQYDAHGNKIGRHTIFYDSSYNQEDENWYYWEYTYDEAGNILDQYEYADDGELLYSYHYTYY